MHVAVSSIGGVLAMRAPNKALALAASLVPLLAAGAAAAQPIGTPAGRGVTGYGSDGGHGTEARFDTTNGDEKSLIH